MKLNKETVLQIAKDYQDRYPNIKGNGNFKIQSFLAKKDNQKNNIWFVTEDNELFGEIHEFIYVISDEKGEVEYTMNELGTKNPHIPESDETWDKFTDEDIERMNNGEWDDKWDNY